jgi:hypothetical protein
VAYPEPNSGGGDNTQPPYPEPTGPSPIQLGLDRTTHNGSNYTQPNSANLPGADAPSGAIPGPPTANLPGNPPRNNVSTGNPGVRPNSPSEPNYP